MFQVDESSRLAYETVSLLIPYSNPKLDPSNWYIYLYIYHQQINIPNVGKYTVLLKRFHLMIFHIEILMIPMGHEICSSLRNGLYRRASLCGLATGP